MSLTLEIITGSEPRLRPYKLADGKSLYLEISPNGGKYWRFKYRFHRKASTVSCGVFPEVSIEKARRRRDSFRALMNQGINPSDNIKAEKAAQRAEDARQIASTRFMLDNDGALAVRLGNQRLALTPSETAELRAFLDATRAVTPRITPCP